MYSVSRNSSGKVDAINRISDGATVPRSDSTSAITQQFNSWLTANPTFDITDHTPTAAAIELLKTSKRSELQAAATAAIREGFTSSALGAPYTYKGRLIDQQNITAAATLSTLKKLSSNITCTNAAGVRDRRAHTQDQAQTVLRDFNNFSETNLAKYRSLINQVNAATTPAQIAAIVWS